MQFKPDGFDGRGLGDFLDNPGPHLDGNPEVVATIWASPQHDVFDFVDVPKVTPCWLVVQVSSDGSAIRPNLVLFGVLVRGFRLLVVPSVVVLTPI